MQTNTFFCDICNINVQSAAEYALHEFSKKHCSNLMRIAKNKKVTKNQNVEVPQTPNPVEEIQQPNVIPAPEVISTYGYFALGHTYETAAEPRELNARYVPYLQNYVPNPHMEDCKVPYVKPLVTLEGGIASLKRKKKKMRFCEICNIMLFTVPEYEAHLKSSQHLLNLKTSGLGVSAHFVKASTDLQTVRNEEKSNEQNELLEPKTMTTKSSVESTASSSIFPMLYCDVCELLLNSEQQFNAHVNGKYHNDNVNKKAEMKAKKQLLENPRPDQLYCYSCKVALNNLYQYNEHKYGKKHQTRCKRLMKQGITIPPEERISSWGMPRLDHKKKVVYPNLYEKFVLAKDTLEKNNQDPSKKSVNEVCENVSSTECESESNKEDSGIRQNKETQQISDWPPEGGTADDVVFSGGELNKGQKHCVIGRDDFLRCNICAKDFEDHYHFDHHLTTEEHAIKIVEVKEKGMEDNLILNILLKDRNLVKRDQFGRYSCSTCSIVAGNAEEFAHHVSTIVHKQSQEDYKRKRSIEILFATKPDENGEYVCKKCQDSSRSLLDYNRHLHATKHDDGIGLGKGKKNMKLFEEAKEKYLMAGLRTKCFTYRKNESEKNSRSEAKTHDAPPGDAENASDSEASETEYEKGARMSNQGTKRKYDDRENLSEERKRTKSTRSYHPIHTKYRRNQRSPTPRSPPRHFRSKSYRNRETFREHHYEPKSYSERRIYSSYSYRRSRNHDRSWSGYPPR